VAPTEIRQYADRDTWAAFDIWNASAAIFARMLTESTLESEALKEWINSLAEQK
jgi:hypothetical protein